MVLSHLGIFFFPQFPVLRIAGTIAMPLFAWLVANGARHSRDLHAYAARLFVLAAVSQIPFAFANGIVSNPFSYLNIVFTLFLGLVAIIYIQRLSNPFLQLAVVGLLALIAQYLNTDYGAAGVLAIAAFYVFFDRFWLTVASQVFILGVLPLVTLYVATNYSSSVAYWYIYYQFQWVSLAALIIIANYNGVRGYPAKYAFYAFYPLHYCVIVLAQILLRV